MTTKFTVESLTDEDSDDGVLVRVTVGKVYVTVSHDEDGVHIVAFNGTARAHAVLGSEDVDIDTL